MAPAPNSCLGTGHPELARYGSNETQSLASTKQQRLIMQTGQRSWHLIDWNLREIVAADSFSAEIEKIIESRSGDWFALVGSSAIEIRSWKNGDLLFQNEEEYSNLRITFTPDGFIAAEHHWSENFTLFYQVKNQGGSFLKTQIARFEGEVSSLVSHTSDDQESILFVIESKQNSGRRLECLRKKISQSTWKPFALELPQNLEPAWLSNFRFPVPKDAIILVQKGERPMQVIDLENFEFHPCQISENETIIGYMRSLGKLHCISGRKSDEKRSYQIFQRSLPDGEKKPLFEGRHVNRWSLCFQGEAVCVWDEEGRRLGYQKVSGEVRWLPFKSKLGSWNPWVHEITEFSEKFIMIECSSGVGTPAILVDLARSDHEAFFIGGASQYRSCVEIISSENSYSAVFLTHRGMALSFFDELLPYEQLSVESATRSWDTGHPVEWLNVDGEGKTKALISKREGSQQSVRYLSENKQKSDWHLTSWRNSENPLALPSHHLLLTAYHKTQLISPEGDIVWLGDASRAKLVHFGGAEFLISGENDRLILREIPSMREHWNLKNSGIILNIVVREKEGEVVILTRDSGLGFGDEKAFFSLKLKRISLDSGEGKTVIWNAPEALVKELGSYGHTFEILQTKPLGILHSSTAQNGDAQYRLLQSHGEEIKETLKWVSDRQHLSKPFYLLSDGSFLARTTQATDANFALTHFQYSSGQWSSFEINLPSALRDVKPDSNGKIGVIQCENHALLYDFNEHKMLGSYLKDSSVYGGILRLVKIAWAPSGDRFYAWSDHRVLEFDASNGKLIQNLRSHHRFERTEITSFAINAEGTWLSTGDNMGQIVTSQLTQPAPKIEELRKRSRFLGGLEIINDDDLEPWIPPLIGE